MSAALNNVTAPDAYNAAATISCPGTVRVRLQVNNQAIYWSRGFSPPGGGGVSYPEREEYLLPGLYSLDERCDAIKIRAAVPIAGLIGAQAQVTIATRTAAELGL